MRRSVSPRFLELSVPLHGLTRRPACGSQTPAGTVFTHIGQTETEYQDTRGDDDSARKREPEAHLRLVDTLVTLGEQDDGTVVEPAAVEEAEECANEQG